MQRYKMLKEMEEGGTFVMHKAKNVKKDQYVAIKIMKKKFYSIEECKNNKEVQILQKLNHKNVLKMLELINDSNELLMVFEYMPDNLKRVMKKRDSPFTETQTKVIMHQVFKGLMHVHKIGFIHRNLRPEVLLCNEEADIVKISDFAMAKSFLDPLGEYTVSPVWYLAPEVLLGANNYSVAVDMWAAGCIMAEFLTGKPLLPGTEVRDQMRKICSLIGTFTPREWPDGAMLRRSIDYSLPKDTNGKGLEQGGVTAGPEAKGLVSDLLTWAPEKRTSAEQALRSEFFKSDGEFVNKGESQEILHSAEEKLRTWREKWEADLTRGSLTEFERILAEITNKQSDKDRQMKSRHTFAGFETNNPLLGDSTPRGKFSESQQNTGNYIDDPFRPHKHKPTGDQRAHPIDNRNVEREADQNPFENDLASREERRTSRQMTQGSLPPKRGSDMSPIRGQMQSPRRMNESPRKKDSDLFGAGPDVKEGEIEMRNKQAKAERMKEHNYLRYRAMYGDDFMRSMLGGKTDSENTGGSRSPIKDGNGGQNKEHVRSSYKSPRRPDTDLFGDTGDAHAQLVKDQENKEMKAKRMKQDNYLKYRALFGDDSMRSMLGGNQTGRDYPVQDQSVGRHGENDNFSPERRDRSKLNRPRDTDLFPGDPDENEHVEQTKAKNAKADKLKQDNYLKFRAKFGDDFMRSMLGGKDGETTVEETEREELNLHWDASPRRRRESPRRQDADLFKADVDTGAGNDELQIKQLKAEKMKEQNYLRYRAKFGDDFMRQTLGGKTGEQEVEENEKSTNRNSRRNGRTSSRRSLLGQNRTRRPDPIGHLSRKSSFDKFASIDHTARSEKLKAQNPLRHKDKYGDDFMRSMLGGNPREQKMPTEQPTKHETRTLGNSSEGHRDKENMENMDAYSPSWNDNGQTRAQ